MQNFHNHAYPRESRGQQALRVDTTTRILLSVALPSLREQVEPALLSAGLIVDPARIGSHRSTRSPARVIRHFQDN